MQQEKSDRFNYLDLLLLIVWFTVGMILRFYHLDNKPASSIEIATLGFSLGHGFSQIPLDTLISASTLLSPLKLDLTINSADVINRLFTESTHPPLYFWLTHWWIRLFTNNGELVSLQVGRSLSAIFGGLSIPAIFGLSWLTFKDFEESNKHRLIAHIIAIMMTFSPYGIYLAQEARHYTLSVLWIIASLSCLIVAIKNLYYHCKIPWWISPVWIVINSLGIATHYFFSLALALEGFVILGFWFWQRNHSQDRLSFNHWLPIIFTGLGTLAGCLVWLPVANNISSNELTDWIETAYNLDKIWQPIPRMFAWLITMVVLLPLEGVPLAIAICSGIIIILGLICLIPSLIRGYKLLVNDSQNLPIVVLSGYSFGTVVLYLALIYGYGKDISLAARYHFVYFPVALLILAAIFARLWDLKQPNNKSKFFIKGRTLVIVVLLMSFLGSLTVVNDFGYKKSRQSNRFVEYIYDSTTVPVIIATTYATLSELRELTALALAIETKSHIKEAIKPQFVLLQISYYQNTILNTILAPQPKPFDLWGVDLREDERALNLINCVKNEDAKLSDAGYKNRVYHCTSN